MLTPEAIGVLAAQAILNREYLVVWAPADFEWPACFPEGAPINEDAEGLTWEFCPMAVLWWLAHHGHYPCYWEHRAHLH